MSKTQDELFIHLDEYHKQIMDKLDHLLLIAKEMNKDSLVRRKNYETKK